MNRILDRQTLWKDHKDKSKWPELQWLKNQVDWRVKKALPPERQDKALYKRMYFLDWRQNATHNISKEDNAEIGQTSRKAGYHPVTIGNELCIQDKDVASYIVPQYSSDLNLMSKSRPSRKRKSPMYQEKLQLYPNAWNASDKQDDYGTITNQPNEKSVQNWRILPQEEKTGNNQTNHRKRKNAQNCTTNIRKVWKLNHMHQQMNTLKTYQNWKNKVTNLH